MFDLITAEALVLLLLLGVFAGFMAGLLGVGGGLIIVPSLIFLFEWWHFPEAILTQMAVATSLACIVFTSMTAVYTHHRNGLVLWPLFFRLSMGLIVGAILGAYLANVMNGQLLRMLFGFFAIAVAAQMGFALLPKGAGHLPGTWGQVLSGVLIATVSAIFGIGGGSLSVPLLSYFGLDIKHAVAVSAACGFPIALCSMLAFVVLGLDKPFLPVGATGYVYWPAVAVIVLASMLCAPLGARLVTRLPAARLKQIFALFLSLVGLRLIVSSL